MKLVFLCPPGPDANVDFRSGKIVAAIQQQIFGLSTELAKKGHDVYILRRWASDVEFEKFNGVTIVNIPMPYPFLNRMKREDNQIIFEALLSFIMYLAFSFKVVNKIKRIKPDIVNISSVLQGFFICGWIKRTKVYITHSHDIYVHNTRYKFLKKLMLKFTLDYCDSIVALTESIKVYLNQMNFKVNAVIPNGINTNQFFNAEDNHFILYSGKLVKHKCVDTLIKSFSEVEKNFPIKLLIVGEGPEKQYLIEEAKKYCLSSVRFLDFQSIAQYRDSLSRCSIFILPSIREAFGVVIIEAMASRKPVIARRITGPADIITHGHDGFLFNDKNELTKFIRYLLENERVRETMACNARQTAEKYSFMSVAEDYIKLYEKLVLDSAV